MEQGVKAFLEKRGIVCVVEKFGGKSIKITTEQVEATAKILDEVSDRNRFLVVHPDYFKAISERDNLDAELKKAKRPFWKKLLRK